MIREEEILNKAIDYSEIEENFLECDDCGDVVVLSKCFETLYRTLDIMIKEYSKMDGFNVIVNKLKRIKEKIGYIDIDTLS